MLACMNNRPLKPNLFKKREGLVEKLLTPGASALISSAFLMHNWIGFSSKSLQHLFQHEAWLA